MYRVLGMSLILGAFFILGSYLAKGLLVAVIFLSGLFLLLKSMFNFR